MKLPLTSSLALLSTASALPTPDATADPLRILPSCWTFAITALSGPGCPDMHPAPIGYNTRLTYGMNTVDGSEIYYWHVAYPYLRARVGADESDAHTWCETTLQYTELDGCLDTAKPAAEYRLRLHKNGTRMLAAYELERGVRVEWRFTYFPGEEGEFVDTIAVSGPRNTTYSDDNSVMPADSKRVAMPKCGTGIIKYRTDLYVAAEEEGATGTVASESHEIDGKMDYYGAQQGFSYDWEKCSS